MEKKKTTKAKVDSNDFENALKELEAIAQRLEGGDLGLEESIKSFERGMKLAHFCNKKLEEAERKIELLQKGDTGEIVAKAVHIDNDTNEVENDEDMQGSLL